MANRWLDDKQEKFLLRRGWRWDDGVWHSPKYPLTQKEFGVILKLNPKLQKEEITEKALEVFNSLQKSDVDYEDARKGLSDVLVDYLDIPRWLFSVTDRVMYVEFDIAYEYAEFLDDLEGINQPGAIRYIDEFAKIAKCADAMGKSNTDSLQWFEDAMRSVYAILQDDEMRLAAGWNLKHWSKIFTNEPEVRSLLSDPRVWSRIDARSNFTQQERLMFLLKIDNAFPEKHVLMSDHPTDYTQKNRAEMAKLVEKKEKGELEEEEADKEFSEIQSKEPEKEPPLEIDSYWNGKEVFINNEPQFSLPDGMDDKKKVKFLARLVTDEYQWIIYPNQMKVRWATKSGISQEFIRILKPMTNEDLAMWERRGFKISQIIE